MEAATSAAPGVPPPPSTSSWVDKVRAALVSPATAGYGSGSTEHNYYHSKFRKSLQTAVLFEAKRSVDRSQHKLKSYERKYALLHQAIHVLDQLVAAGIVKKDGPMRGEILWKTATSQQLLDAETAWRRIKAVERELEGLAQQIKPYYYGSDVGDSGGSIVSHDEAVDRMVRAQYDANPTDYVKAYRDVMGTREWELAHNHLLFTFRLYYKGSQLDPDFPLPDELVYNGSENGNGDGDGRGSRRNGPNASSRGRTNHESHSQQHSLPAGDEDERTEDLATGAAGMGAATGTAASGATAAATTTASVVVVDPVADERRNLLREVKDHLDILKEFEGWVSPDELAQRKRALFLALPPAPPPLATPTSAVISAAAVPPPMPTASPSRSLRQREPPPTSPEPHNAGAKRTRS